MPLILTELAVQGRRTKEGSRTLLGVWEGHLHIKWPVLSCFTSNHPSNPLSQSTHPTQISFIKKSFQKPLSNPDTTFPLSKIPTFLSPLLNNPVFFLPFSFVSSFSHHPHALLSVSERKTMEQQAKEELEMLESLYPDRFEYLKLDLKSFISQHHHHDLSEPPSFHPSMVDTQESSSLNQRKRKKKKSTADGDSENSDQHDDSYRSVKKKKDRVDLVLERAEACLRKIRQLKASLLSDS